MLPCFWCSGCEASCQLKPGEVQLFVWDNPAGVRKLCWTCQGHSAELDLIKVREVQHTPGLQLLPYWIFCQNTSKISQVANFVQSPHNLTFSYNKAFTHYKPIKIISRATKQDVRSYLSRTLMHQHQTW